MKGKVTKDILLRVGQGVMRIPRPKDESAIDKNQKIDKKKRPAPAGKADHS